MEDVTEREIVLRTEDGDQIACGLAPPHPTSHRTVTYHRPCVRAGREVTEGMLLADGAATCNGKLALGVNVLAAYMPYKGLNFEDGIVISDRLVRDDILTSLHMVRERFEVCEGEHVRCPDGWYSGDEKDEIVELYERAGVYCRAGEEVRRGDPLFGKVCFRNGEKAVIYALAPVDGRIVSVLHREIDQTAGVEAGGGDGVVEDYRPRVRFFKECRILTERRAEVGDKLMGRHGNKGVIARIVPEAEMPHMKDGTPVDVVLNPHGVVSRMNLGQILETHWSWVVRKGCGRYDRYSTVAPFEVFPEEDLRAALESLSETGVSADGKFELLDGRNGKPFKTRIVAGYQYFMKLNHLVEDKLHARETGPCSMMVKQPVKGKKRGGGQRLGEMEVWALQSHSCPFLLREMLTVKSDLAEFHKGSLAAEQWNRAFPLDGSATMTGSFHAALMLLRGFGLETVFRDEAGRRHTLEDLKKGGEASRVRSVRLRFAGPEEIEAWADGGALTTDKMPSSSRDGGWDYPAGGLFDPALFNPRTGKPELDRDLKREKMGFIPLAAPVIHPLLIDDIAARVSRKLQGSKERKEIIRAVRFEAFRDGSGRFHSFRDLGYRCACGGLSGGILSGEGCFLCRSDNAGSQDPGDPRLDAGASLLLRLAEETGLDLSGNVLMTRIPVLPLDFRPLRATQGDNLLQSDLNTFYRDILTVNRRLGDLEENSAARPENPRDRLMRLILARRLQIGVVRLMVGTRFTRQKNMKSISDLIKGKEGIFRMHLLGKRANVSGRSVIVPGPELRPHEVGIPRQMLEGLIGTKLQSHLVTQIEADERKDRLQAVGALKARGLWHYFASIDNLLRRVPFVLNRSPSLHKYSVLAFRPVPVREKAIVLNPLACRAFNADFDGDTMSVFVPLFEESRREAAENMAATRNVLSVANGRLLYHFDQDIVLGIYLLTSSEKGRAEFNGWFEEADLEPQAGPVDKGKLEEHVLQYHLALRDNARTAGLAQRIMVRGFAEATEWGTNFGIFDVPGKNDLGSPGGLLDEGVLERELKAWIGKHGLIPGDAKPEEVVRTTNPLALLAHSGAKGGTKQLMQLGIMRGQLQDVRGEKLGPVVSGNFRDGISPIEYYIGSHSGRRTMCEKKLSVAKAGDLTRTLVEASYPLRIRTDDCGSREGILLFPFPDIPLEGGKRRLPSLGSRLIGRTRLDGTADSPGDRKLLQAIEASGRAVRVRSALTCRAHEKHGYGAVCRACYGWDLSRMDFPGIGDPVGIWASQSLGERGTQLSMRTFHTGGAGGEGAIIGGLTFIQRLFVCSQVQLLLYSVVDPGDYPWSRGTRLDAWTLLSSWEEGKIFPTVEPAPEEEGDGAQRPLPRSLQEQFDLVGGDLSKLQAVAAFECCRTYDNAVDERHIEVILKAMLLRDSRELTSIKRAPFAHPGFLAQAAYQQAMRVLVEAALSGTEDHLQHPKARIMLGMPIDTTE
ncbi:MAG: hypothetical protein LLG06_15285 [Desulfobacteraceae bacterium]|nr:hypothetical protein [Desulfobacteraceae bacterium]